MYRDRLGTNRVLTGLLLVGASAAAALPEPRASAPIVEQVLKCRAIADGQQRLACFDSAVGSMAEATTKGDLLTLDREQRRAVRRQAFGLTLPSFNLFDKGERPEEVNRLVSKAASAFKDPRGKWVVKLEDGAVWRQTDDNEIFRDPHPGSTVLIERASLGSFFMIVDRQQAVRAKREN